MRQLYVGVIVIVLLCFINWLQQRTLYDTLLARMKNKSKEKMNDSNNGSNDNSNDNSTGRKQEKKEKETEKETNSDEEELWSFGVGIFSDSGENLDINGDIKEEDMEFEFKYPTFGVIENKNNNKDKDKSEKDKKPIYVLCDDGKMSYITDPKVQQAMETWEKVDESVHKKYASQFLHSTGKDGASTNINSFIFVDFAANTSSDIQSHNAKNSDHTKNQNNNQNNNNNNNQNQHQHQNQNNYQNINETINSGQSSNNTLTLTYPSVSYQFGDLSNFQGGINISFPGLAPLSQGCFDGKAIKPESEESQNNKLNKEKEKETEKEKDKEKSGEDSGSDNDDNDNDNDKDKDKDKDKDNNNDEEEEEQDFDVNGLQPKSCK